LRSSSSGDTSKSSMLKVSVSSCLPSFILDNGKKFVSSSLWSKTEQNSNYTEPLQTHNKKLSCLQDRWYTLPYLVPPPPPLWSPCLLHLTDIKCIDLPQLQYHEIYSCSTYWIFTVTTRFMTDTAISLRIKYLWSNKILFTQLALCIINTIHGHLGNKPEAEKSFD
jgi:hypothetical protein